MGAEFRHVDIAVLGSEGEAVVEEYDAGDSLGEAAEAVAVGVRSEGGEEPPGRDVEKTDRAVKEAGGEVTVGEGEAAAAQVVGGRGKEGEVGGAASTEIGSCAVEMDVFLAPGREGATAAGPYAAAEDLP